MSDRQTSSDRVRDVWSQPPEHKMTSWMEHPLVRTERLNRMVSGRPDQDCHQWFIELVQRLGMTLPVARCLTIGCGFGDLERGYSQYNFTSCHDGIDVADGAIEAASEAARAEGYTHICYRRADMNTAELPRRTYDILFGHQSIHHIERLEHLAEQARRALKPGGLFMLNEYIGLNHLQVAPDQQAFGSGLMQLLPERYVRKPDGTLRRTMEFATADQVIAYDPSEAVRSEDIVDVLSGTLEVVERRDYGGNILQLGLHEIVGNFCTGNPRDEAWLRWLFDAEDRLLDEDGVTSDFAVLILRRPT